MKDAQVLPTAFEHGGSEDIDILHTLVLLEVDEALTLYARHVEDIYAADHLGGEVRRLRKWDPSLPTEVLALLGLVLLQRHHAYRRGA